MRMLGIALGMDAIAISDAANAAMAAANAAISSPLPPASQRRYEFSADGERILGLGEDIVIWETATGLPLTDPCPHGDDVYSACFDPAGRRVLTSRIAG